MHSFNTLGKTCMCGSLAMRNSLEAALQKVGNKNRNWEDTETWQPCLPQDMNWSNLFFL